MKAILFDLDDTLYSRQDTFAKAYRKTFTDGPLRSLSEAVCSRQDTTDTPDYASLFLAFRQYGYDVYEDSMSGRISMEEMFIYRIRRTMEEIGISLTDEQALLFQEQYAWEQAHLQLTKPIEEMLAYVAGSSWLLGIVTNGESKHQRKKYDALKLERFMPPEFFLPTGDAGVSKPDPEVFRIATRLWNLVPEDTWYVGDSYLHDVVCASSLGWHTVWLRRPPADDAPEGELPVKPDYTAASEEELRETVRKIIAE